MNMKKVLAMMLAVVLIVTATIAGTVAWLMDDTDPVANFFDTTTIGVDLEEHEYDADAGALAESTTKTGVDNYKMIPGFEIPKDPKAWITDGSVDAYLFVKVEESPNFDSFMTYAIAGGWTLLSVEGDSFDDVLTDDNKINTDVNDTYVIFRVVDGNEIDTKFDILADNKVTVKGEVTKDMMESAKNDNPALIFTAYAHQLYSTNGEEFTPAAAWANLNP